MASSFYVKSILSTLAAFAVSTQVYAEDFILHEGDNTLPKYVAVNATFTPDDDCKVVIASNDQFESVKYDGHTYTATYLPTQSPANVYEIDNVSAGTTISLYSGFVLNPLVRITTYQSGAVIPVELMNTSPAAGSSDFWANNGLLELTFNKLVTLDDAKISIGSQHYNAEIVHVSSSISINVGTTLNQLLTDGTLRPGQAFMVTLSGLRDAKDPSNLYNGTGTLNLRFPAPQPQYSLLSATVGGQMLYTSGLNEYTFLSFYAPDGEDGLFTLEFGADVKSAGKALIQMGNRDLDGQGKYHESQLPLIVEGNKVHIDARGVLRTLNILFPAVVEDEPEPGEVVNEDRGKYDNEHITLRVSNVIDINGNYFSATQAGNIGSYSFYMNYRELMETINLDGDSHMAGASIAAGDVISLWLSSAEMRFDGLQINYLALLGEDLYEPRTVTVTDFTTEPDPYEGIIITFTLPELPDVAPGQPIRVSLLNASSADGMPHDIGITYEAADPAGIHCVHYDMKASAYVYTLTGQRVRRDAVAPHTPYIDQHIIKF